MDENTNIESAEMQEVAEPADEALESAETQEVAEPESEAEISETEAEEHGKTDADAAFAEMRRSNQTLERENQMMREALLRYFDGETAEELSINANAYAEQRDPDEYREEWEHNQEYEAALAENEDLKEQLLNAQVEKLMREDLAEIQAIDPSVKSLDDLGDVFLKMRLNGDNSLSAKQAFYAVRAMQLNEKVLAPDAIGKVADTKAERDYFTSEEIDALTDEELDDPAIYEKVMKSLPKLNRKG